MSASEPVLLRLTSRCNSGCEHCPVADLRELDDLPLDDAVATLERGRESGATAVTFVRGEATLVRSLVKLVRRARELGYTEVKLETNGRMLSYPEYVDKLVAAGLTDVVMSVFAHIAPLHDAIDGSDGAHVQAMVGLARVLAAPVRLEVRVPVVRRNFAVLSDIVAVLRHVGVRRVTFEYPEPVKVGPAWQVGALVRLDVAAPFVRDAIERAESLKMEPRTLGFPLCQLGPRASTYALVGPRAAGPAAPVCAGCGVSDRCPKTWASYQRTFGTWELRPAAVSAT